MWELKVEDLCVHYNSNLRGRIMTEVIFDEQQCPLPSNIARNNFYFFQKLNALSYWYL